MSGSFCFWRKTVKFWPGRRLVMFYNRAISWRTSCSATVTWYDSELILHYTLHYLAGGSVHDIQVCAGMSKGSFYRAIHHGIDAINSCPSLQIKFPVSLHDLTKSANEFHSPSAHGIWNGCVGALDGWLCQIHVPSANEVKKVKSYFSGQYQCYGFTVQATDGLPLCLFSVLEVLLIVRPFMPPGFTT